MGAMGAMGGDGWVDGSMGRGVEGRGGEEERGACLEKKHKRLTWLHRHVHLPEAA